MKDQEMFHVKHEDIEAPCRGANWWQNELETLRRNQLFRARRTRRGPLGPWIEINGNRYLNFSSNDYLGLGAGRVQPGSSPDEWLSKQSNLASGASRLVIGDTAEIENAEHCFAEFLGAEASLLFNSGYAANVGTIPAISHAQDIILSDALNHASIVDGCRLSRAKTIVYPHRDVVELERHMAVCAGESQRIWVVTESVFSMDGDVAPLSEISALCQRYGALLYVDEAHSIGLCGPHGRGLCVELGIQPDVHMAALGKAFALCGAFISGPRGMIELLWNRARSHVYSTAMSPLLASLIPPAIARIHDASGSRRRLRNYVAKVRDCMTTLEEHNGSPREASETLDKQGRLESTYCSPEERRATEASARAQPPRFPILPWVVGEESRAIALQQRLERAGFLIVAMRPPTVPPGTCRLRIIPNASHEPEHIDLLCETLRELCAPT